MKTAFVRSKKRVSLRMLLGSVVLLATLCLPSCFSLREPEAPTAASDYLAPTQIDILLANFTTSVQTLNTVNYERNFSGPQYRFVPDPGSAGTAASLFTNWSVSEERDYFSSLRRRSPTTSQNQLTLTTRPYQFFTTDSAEVSALYQLRIVQSDTAFKSTMLEGNIRLLVRRRNNEWKIAGWRDQRTSNALSWTDLKKHFIRN
ncbi:hypothetical protein MTX78_09925 [Hymenobacter tibetensis]|uniref:DUF4440 domain-containing protein n=1 Tax=Hymenobacter tibetensis TaxID=497967 RepID=A0ABY4D9Y1_9BACT|nr:hypothetical protein [Hymenobacter tibetensis]UOG76898.1 hypothetical protein MTX78_09925 [Hymenobacter tibetensis]